MAVDFSIKGFENSLRLVVPMMLLVVLFFLSITALPVPGLGSVKPSLMLMTVYYWSIYRPTLMPPFLCFAIGLLMDFMTGLPLGVNAVLLTLVQWIVRDQRKFLMGQAYFTIWSVFALVATLVLAAQWGMYGLAARHWAPIVPVMFSLLATVLLFPVVTLLLIGVHKILPATQKGYP